MKLFGWSIIRTSELEILKKNSTRISRLTEVYRWFAGWKDLDIIWSYIIEDNYYGGIDSARKRYARLRGTGIYGEENEWP